MGIELPVRSRNQVMRIPAPDEIPGPANRNSIQDIK